MFFLLDGDTNASSRHRVLQYLPVLRAAGIEARVSRPVPQPLYSAIMEGRRKATAARAAFYAIFLAQRYLDVVRSGQCDVAVIQRDLFPFGPPVLERLLWSVQPRVVYDADDATFLRPAFTPRTVFQKLRRFDKVADVVRRSRWVSVSTEPIAAWARRFNPRVSVVPMAVDPAEYDLARRTVPCHAAGPRVVLGWAGTPGGLAYVQRMAAPLRSVNRGTPIALRIITGQRPALLLPEVPWRWVPWSPESNLQDMACLDIGVVPLDDTPFERAKFPFKLLQLLALGVPVICSRVGAAATLITHGVTGLLASSDAEWEDAIRQLALDPLLRRRLGEAGRDLVRQHYTLERVAPVLIDGLRRAAA